MPTESEDTVRVKVRGGSPGGRSLRYGKDFLKQEDFKPEVKVREFWVTTVMN